MATVQGDGKRMKKKKPETLLQKKPMAKRRIPSKQVAVHDREKPKRRRAILDGPDCNIRISVLERAREIQSSLPLKFPTLVRPMLPSHVAGCFWLGLPKRFCTLYLPKQDTDIILEDESGKKHRARYLWQKTGLSGGWRWFSISHSLKEGDVIVFQLVKATEFKVYIVRSSSSDEVDGALSLLKLDHTSKKVTQARTDTNTTDAEEDGMHWEPLQKEILEENVSADKHRICAADPCFPTDQPGLDSEDVSAEVLDGSKFSESVFDFENMASKEDFAIVVNGLVVDSKLPKHLRAKYYELCCSQKSVLHKKLLRGLSRKLATGIISETVNIADAVRAAKITTSVQNFTVWGKTLKAFKDLGMDVGFLQARLDRLMDLAIKSKRMEDARRERAVAEEEMSVLEAKALEVKSKISKLDAEITILDKNEGMFRELSAAPW